jgi:LmbE family N-acetylglucosaminyl deacetylase
VARRIGYAQFAAVFRRLLVASARDATETLTGARTLVLAPHADDETTGCGATLARKRAGGATVRVCVVTDGGASAREATLGHTELARVREVEGRDACAALGIDASDVSFLGWVNGALTTVEPELVEQLAKVIEEFQPDELLLTFGIDVQLEHRVVFHAGLAAHRKASSGARVLAYPVHFWRPSTWTDPDATPLRKGIQRLVRPLAVLPRLHTRKVRTGPYLDAKRRALDAYGGEFGSYEWIPGSQFTAEFLTPEELFFEIDPARPRVARWQRGPT